MFMYVAHIFSVIYYENALKLVKTIFQINFFSEFLLQTDTSMIQSFSHENFLNRVLFTKSNEFESVAYPYSM